MVTKTQAEIEKLFAPYLLKGEEFRWINEPKFNIWTIKWQQLPDLLTIGLLVFLWGSILVFLLRLFLFDLSVGFFSILLVSVVALASYFARKYDTRPVPQQKNIFQLTYYCITNKRVIVFEQSIIRDYSLLLMADAVVSKPENEASTIYIYNQTNPTGQLPEPIFELKGIAEDEAQAAYEILRLAREEALENRAREMGIE